MKLAGWSPLTAPEKTSIIEGSVKGEYKLAEPAINVFAKLSTSSAYQGKNPSDKFGIRFQRRFRS